MKREQVEELLLSHRLEPRKVLGQNFVVDDQVIENIVELAQVGSASSVIEIGPGLGALTSVLAARVRRLVAVEKDESLIPLLSAVVGSSISSETASRCDFKILQGDALTLDWNQVLDPHDQWALVANLPYNVAVPILMGVLEAAPMVTRGIVMVQLEVAQRLAASPGGRTIGVPSIGMAWYADAEVVGLVAPEVFHPVPNVASALLSFKRREAPSTSVGFAEVMDLVGTAYRKRRKMLRSSVGAVISPELFEAASIDPTARPETLALKDWVSLAEMLRSQRMSS